MIDIQQKEQIQAEVVAVFPNKVKINVTDIVNFKLADEKLAVGSYLRISDSHDCAIIAAIENFCIEKKDDASPRVYSIEAIPIGFLDKEGKFWRGGNNLAIPPTGVAPAKADEIKSIYSQIEEKKRFIFADLVQDKTIDVPVDGDKFFNKHIAIVGSTGSGKSHTLASILQRATAEKEGNYSGLNNSHIIIFDIHLEYKQAFPNANFMDVSSMTLPYWLLNSEELEDLFIESHEEQSHNQISTLKRLIIENKQQHFKGDELEKQRITYDTPTYFSINEVLQAVIAKNEEMIPGVKGEKMGPLNGKLSNFINRLEGKITDKRLEFLMGERTNSISFEETLRQFIGYVIKKEANITVIDLSGVPFEVLSISVSLITRLIFEYGYYFKKIKGDNETKTPILLVYEEAHKYVPKIQTSKYQSSRTSIERVAKEGRKYGVTLIILSQRPSEISETIFSQCNNFIAMRLTNPEDQNYVKRLLPDSLGAVTDSLPILQSGEALLIGDAVVMPSLVKIKECNPQPASNDINYMQEWKKPWLDLDFSKITEGWKK
jgi:uncharacterized protein